MGFPGVLKKNRAEVPGVNLKRSAISRVVQEKTMWNFHGSLFLNLNFQGVSQNFAEIPGVKAYFLFFYFPIFTPLIIALGGVKMGHLPIYPRCVSFLPQITG